MMRIGFVLALALGIGLAKPGFSSASRCTGFLIVLNTALENRTPVEKMDYLSKIAAAASDLTLDERAAVAERVELVQGQVLASISSIGGYGAIAAYDEVINEEYRGQIRRETAGTLANPEVGKEDSDPPEKPWAGHFRRMRELNWGRYVFTREFYESGGQ